MTREQWAYIAGLFDGEGCIQIFKAKPYGSNVSPTFQLTVGIRNTDTEVMRWLHQQCGGSLYDQKGHGGNPARSWYWSIWTKEARVFLQAIKPYLIIKSQECQIALDFCAHVEEYKHSRYDSGGKRGRPTLPPEILDKREGFVARLKHIRSSRKRY